MGTMKDGNDTKPEVIRGVLRESVDSGVEVITEAVDYSLGKIPNIFDGFPVVGTLVTILKTYNTIRETILKTPISYYTTRKKEHQQQSFRC